MRYSVSFTQTKRFGNTQSGLSETLVKPNFFLAVFFPGYVTDQKDKDAAKFIKDKFGKTADLTTTEFKQVLSEAVRVYNVVDVAVVAVVGGILNAASLGEVSVKIIRNGNLVNLLSGSNEIFFSKGMIQLQDIVLVGGNDFFNRLSSNILLEGLSTPNFKSSLEIIENKAETSGYEGFGAFFVKIGSSDSKVKRLNIRLTLSVKNYIDKLLSKLPKKPHIEIRENNKISVSVGIILITLLVISVFFGAFKKTVTERTTKEKEIVNEVEHKVSEAESIFLLNPVRARELILSAKTILGEFDGKKDVGKELEDLRIKVQNAEKNILGEYKTTPETFLNLALLSDGFTGNNLTGIGSDIYIFDRKGKKIVRVGVESKRSEVIAGPKDVGDAFLVVPSADKVYFLSQKGVFESGGKEVVAGEFDEEVLGVFYAKNLYLLDGQKSQILRYALSDGSFLGAQEWLSKDVEAGLSSAKSFISDGFLWVLDKDSNTLKFSRGNKLRFSISGFETSNFSPEALYTDEDQKCLYFLDRTEGRIVVIDKDGKYKAQYISDKLKSAKGIFASEKVRKAFFLTDGEIMSVVLEHIQQ